MLEGSQVGEGGPAPILSHQIMVEQRAVVAAPNERMISAKPEVQTFTKKAGVVLQRAPIQDGVPAPVSPALSKSVHYGLLPVIVEVFTEQPRTTVEELQAFSAFCNEMFRSDASNQTSPPGADTA